LRRCEGQVSDLDVDPRDEAATPHRTETEDGSTYHPGTVIVFGYDGSEDAQRAIDAASRLMSGRALVVHVWEPVPRGAGPVVASPGVPGAGMPALGEVERELEQEARSVLEDGARRAAEAGFDVETQLVPAGGGVAWRDLLDVVEQRRATALVVGRRGVSRLRSVLMGSVSEGAVKHARVPVLVVPPEATP
jgi:nucleotide-binding universal stress UspA family protein